MPNKTYRPDIDGLRAVAIALVVIFHAFPRRLPGGFIGVDVFFVISGYLMSRRHARHFDFAALKTFYAARARRLLPALLVMLVAVTWAAMNVMFPDEYADYLGQLRAALTFSSNLGLTRGAGYFDRAAETNPLLHLWSLAVEEQFYLALPLVYWVTSALGRHPGFGLIPYALASVAFNVYHRGGPSALVYYHPLARHWEILAGSLLALFGTRLNLRPAVGLVAVTALALGTWWAGRGGIYPDARALLPVLAAVLVIGARPTAWLNRILAHAGPVYLGQISYPLYLWHWPVLWAFRVEFGPEVDVLPRLAAVALSVVLAVVTYEFWEKKRRVASERRQIGWATALLATVFVASRVPGKDLNLNRLDPSLAVNAPFDSLEPRCGVDAADNSPVVFCARDRRAAPRAALWGDSKAHALATALMRQSRAGERWLLVGRPGCAPQLKYRRTSFDIDDGAECVASNALVFDRLAKDQQIEFVWFVPAGRILFDHTYAPLDDLTRRGDSVDGLVEAMAALRRSGKRVGLLIDNPNLAEARACARPGFGGAAPAARRGCTRNLAAYESEVARFDRARARLHERVPDALVHVPIDDLCDRSAGICAFARDQHSLYSYGDHLSDFGASFVARSLVEKTHAALAR